VDEPSPETTSQGVVFQYSINGFQYQDNDNDNGIEPMHRAFIANVTVVLEWFKTIVLP
jgi:hypothetical protein